MYYSRSQAAHPDFPVLLRCWPASPVAGSWASLSRGWKGLGLWVRGKFLKTLGPGPQQRASRASAPCPRYHYTYPVRCQCSDAHRVRRFTDPSNLVSLATAWLQVWVFLGKSPLRTGRLQVWVFLGKSPLATGLLQVWVFLGKSPLATGRLQVWVFLGKSPLETGRLQVWVFLEKSPLATDQDPLSSGPGSVDRGRRH